MANNAGQGSGGSWVYDKARYLMYTGSLSSYTMNVGLTETN